MPFLHSPLSDKIYFALVVLAVRTFAFLLGKLFCREIISNRGDKAMHYYCHISETVSQLGIFEFNLHMLNLNSLK